LFIEKNPTIVTFPIEELDLKDFVESGSEGTGQSTTYNLIANICHEGKASDGTYKIHIQHKRMDQWFEIEDLDMRNIMKQLINVSEGYLQFYERVEV